MAYRFDTEEDEETGRRTLGRKRRGAREEDDSAEITLGARSLLGIFFGLVLICAIFFGLGYSVGRGSSAKAALAPSATQTPVATAPNGSLGKPSPQETLAAAPETQAAPITAPDESAPALEPAATPVPAAGSAQGGLRASAAAPSSPAAATVKPAGFPSAVPGAANPPVARPAVATIATNGIMVQVAAISMPRDADILVDALKKHGYTATVRNEPADKLLHVQLGPFASRAEAYAMRSKLLADGYNAVVK